MRRRIACLIIPFLLVWTVGCFEIEQTVELEKDLSGTASFTIGMDMEPMVYMMAAMQKAFSGEEGVPTEEEIAAAREEMLASKDEQPGPMDDLDEEEIADELPEGVTLLGVEAHEEGLEMGVTIRVAFDHVSKLSEIDFEGAGDEAEGSEEAAGPEETTDMFANAFGAFTFSDEGDTMLITTETSNPIEEMEDRPEMAMAPDEEEQVERMFENLRVAFQLRLPFHVVEHNATRVEGDTYFWEYTYETLAAMAESGESLEGVMVRFRK